MFIFEILEGENSIRTSIIEDGTSKGKKNTNFYAKTI